MRSENRICVGAIAGAFGVRGEVRLKSFTAHPEDIAAYNPLHSEDGQHSFSVNLIGQTKNGFTARLSGIQTKVEEVHAKGFQGDNVLPIGGFYKSRTSG